MSFILYSYGLKTKTKGLPPVIMVPTTMQTPWEVEPSPIYKTMSDYVGSPLQNACTPADDCKAVAPKEFLQ